MANENNPMTQRLDTDGMWRTYEHVGSTPVPKEPADNHSITPRIYWTPKRSRTPSGNSNLDLILDALTAHPDGLRTRDIIEWLKNNRPESFRNRPEEKLQASLQATLSAQTHKKDRRIWKYVSEGDNGSSYYWKIGSPLSQKSPYSRVSSGNTHETSEASVDGNDNAHASVRTSSRHSNSMQHEPSPRHDTRPGDKDCDPSAPVRHDEPSGPLDLETRGQASAAARTTEGNVTQVSHNQDHQSRSPNSVTHTPLAQDNSTSNAIAAHENGRDDSTATFARPSLTDRAQSATSDARQSAEQSSQSSESQDVYFGQLVRQIHALRDERAKVMQEIESKQASIGDIDALKKELEESQHRAAEQEALAKEARRKVDSVRAKVELTAATQAEEAAGKRNLQNLEEQLQTARKKLRID